MDAYSNRKYIKSIISNVSSDGDEIEEMLWNVYGTTDKEAYLNCVYQIIGDIINGKDSTDIMSSVKNGHIDWEHSSYDVEKHAILEQDDFIEHPFEVEEGVLECRCGSKRVYSFSKQTRSADEPMTTYAECVQCNAKWSYSG